MDTIHKIELKLVFQTALGEALGLPARFLPWQAASAIEDEEMRRYYCRLNAMRKGWRRRCRQQKRILYHKIRAAIRRDGVLNVTIIKRAVIESIPFKVVVTP